MAIDRGTNCMGVLERLRMAPGLRWAKTSYTASGMIATVVDAHDGTEYELVLQPKADQWPRPIGARPVVAGVTEFDRQQFLRSECPGCGHVSHVAGECRQRATFSKRECECDVHMGEYR